MISRIPENWPNSTIKSLEISVNYITITLLNDAAFRVYCVARTDKGKPAERWGRKTMGLRRFESLRLPGCQNLHRKCRAGTGLLIQACAFCTDKIINSYSSLRILRRITSGSATENAFIRLEGISN